MKASQALITCLRVDRRVEASADRQPDEDDEDSDLAGDRGDTEFVDGSEAGGRRLSKAERKRLKKLARMNGYAA